MEVIDLTIEDEVSDPLIKRPRLDGGMALLDLLPEPIFQCVIGSSSITDVMHLRSTSRAMRRLVEGVVGIISRYRLPIREEAARIAILCVTGPIDIHRQLCVDINRYPKLKQLYIAGVTTAHGYGQYVPLFLGSFGAPPGENVKVVSQGVACNGFLSAILNHPRVSDFVITGVSPALTRHVYRLDGWWFENPGGMLYPNTLRLGGPFLYDMSQGDVRHAWVLCNGAERYEDAVRIFTSEGTVFYTRFNNLGEVCRTQHLVNQLRERGCNNLRGSHDQLIRRIYSLDGLDYDVEMEQMREAEIRQADCDLVHFWELEGIPHSE